MWEAINAEEVDGIKLSESLSMLPAASVSALVFAYPESQYFAFWQIGTEQVESYAQMKKYDISPMERWLSTILNYDHE